MKMPFKVALTAMIGVLAMAFAASFMLTNLVSRDSIKSKQSLLLQLRRSTRSLVELQSEQLADRLAKLIEKESQNLQDLVALKQSDFVAVGLLTESSSETNGWGVEGLKSKTPAMTAAWLKEIIPSLPLAKVKGEELSWARVAMPDGQVYFMLLVEVQVKVDNNLHSRISVGVLPTSIFSDINIISKGEENSVFVVDGQGGTFSYPDQQYVGSKITTHPLVAHLIKNQAIEFTGEVGRAGGDALVGGYDKINGTNLYVVAATPLSARGGFLTQFIFQIAIVCLSLMLIVALAVIYFISSEMKKIEIMKQNIDLMQASAKVAPMVVATGSDSLRDFASAVARYLRRPTASIVGHMQIVDSKNENKALKDSLDKITNETRKVRAFSDAMIKALNISSGEQEILTLNPIVSQVVSAFRAEMTAAGIHFEENFKADCAVRGNHDELKNSIKSIFSYVVQTIQTATSNKKLLLNIEKNGGMALISIEGQGVELKSEVRRKLFLPFEVTVPKSKIMGLDLALAQNYFHEINGEVTVEAIGSMGFRISIQLPTAVKLSDEPVKADTLAKKIEPIVLPKLVAEGSSIKLPPAPIAAAPQEVKVVKDLTLNPDEKKSAQPSNEKGGVSIRKPKLRIDT
ncbi:MAG: sensor histidine kinase [Bdellovibrionales bacterium]|nr:sensor histidine kinase [Bdellovibrionales bacterium]